jgi:hypothetical protein
MTWSVTSLIPTCGMFFIKPSRAHLADVALGDTPSEQNVVETGALARKGEGMKRRIRPTPNR